MNKCYIIVLWHNGIPHFLQTNNKMAWCYFNDTKAYIRLGCAINAAKKLNRKYVNDRICVYHIPYSMSFSSCDFVQGKFNNDLVHEIRKC